MVKSSRGLGKGLDALFRVEEAEKEAINNKAIIKELELSELRPNPYQPRKEFKEETLDELKQSIISNGIVQPLIVRESSIKGYEIIAGERRFRAAKLAGLKTVPAVIKEFVDSQMMEVALLENLQREDLNPLEEAEAYLSIMKKLSYTQEFLAERMGKSRSHVANYLRLISLPIEVKKMLSLGQITIGHAKVLLSLKDEDIVNLLAKRIIKEKLTVRELEDIISKEIKNDNKLKNKNGDKKEIGDENNYFLQEQTIKLCEKLGTKVNINMKSGKFKGKIEINFLSEEDLERLLNQLGNW